MPNILHVIEHLDLGGASRSTIATAKYSAQLDGFDHIILALVKADPEAIELAKKAGLTVFAGIRPEDRERLWQQADIVEVAYWNAPFTQALLRSALPPARLVVWYHIAGDNSPQVIPTAVAAMSDLNIACCPYTFEEHPLFRDQLNLETPTRTAMVYGSADFQRFSNISRKQHEGFNIGYIGTVDFVKMHPDYVRMSASIDIPDARFIVCGNGIQDLLKRQAQQLQALERFDFRGYVSDIASVIETLDLYGYPLCEDTYAAAELNLQEVMYAGITPVVFPYGGVKRLIKHNETGLIVDSVEDYKLAIEYLYHNTLERDRLGRNAAAYAKAHFGAENAAKNLVRLYARLMEQPKRHHVWDAHPAAVNSETLVNVQAESAAHLFADSLCEYGDVFQTSLCPPNEAAVIEAEKAIANATELVANTGFIRYRAFDPTDSHLRLWTGLYMERKGAHPNAITEYAAAIENGATHWRVKWYLARALHSAGKVNEARRLYASLRQQQPNFDELTGDSRCIEETTTTLSFSTKPLEPTAKPDQTHTGTYRVSAIVSTYNSEAFIDGCLHDLVNQTLYKKGELEIIVIDACSEENEQAVVARYQAYYDHIKYERTAERETLYASWNRAIRMASGQYITNANADDRHRNDALEVLANYLDAHPEFALLYAGQIDTSIPNETFDTTSSSKVLNWPPYTYAELERHCIIGSQPVWRRSLHETYGYFREEFKSAGDYEFWLRIGRRETFYRYPETLGLYYRNLAGIEHGSDDSKNETLRIWQEYGMFERGIPLILGGRLVTSAQIAQIAPETGESIAPPAFDVLINQFEKALLQQNLASAVRIAETAILHYPSLPYPFVLKAIALRQLGNYSQALETLDRSIAIDETPEALIELRQLSQATGNMEEAGRTDAYIRARYPEWALRLDTFQGIPPEKDLPADALSNPTDTDFSRLDIEALQQQFEHHLQRNDPRIARTLAETAVQRFPQHYRSWLIQAANYRLNGQFKLAEKAIQQSLLIKDTPEAIVELMHLEMALDNLDEAAQLAAHIALNHPELVDEIPAALLNTLPQD